MRLRLMGIAGLIGLMGLSAMAQTKPLASETKAVGIDPNTTFLGTTGSVMNTRLIPISAVIAATQTNTQGILGAQDDSLNFNRLNKFYMAAHAQGRAVRMFSITDLTGFPGSDTQIAMFAGYLGWQGGGLTSGGGSDGDLEADLSGGVTQSTPTDGVWYTPLYNLHNTDTITWRKRNSSRGDTSVGGTNVLASKYVLRYVIETGGGTFKVQTNYNGGGWVDWSGTISASGSTNGGVYSNTLPVGYYSVRIVGLSGTVRVQDAGLWNDGIGQISGGTWAINNCELDCINNCNTNVTWPWFGSLAPDLLMILDTGSTSDSEWGLWEKMMTNVSPNSSEIWCNNHYVIGDNTQPGINAIIRTNALRYGRAYFDAYYAVGTNISELIADGIISDGIHPTPAGTDYLNYKLFKKIMESAGEFTSTYIDPKFRYGTGPLSLFNTGNTNPIGIGIATPSPLQGRLQVQDGYANIFMGSGGTGAAMLGLFSSTVSVPATLTQATVEFYTDGQGLNIHAPDMINGDTIFGQTSAGIEQGRFWRNDTGFSVGNFGDAAAHLGPGQGIIRAQNGMLSLGSNKAAPASISVTGSPFNWTNTFNVNVNVFINGGTVSAVAVNGTTVLSSGNTTISLQPNEWVTVTYSVAPTMRSKTF